MRELSDATKQNNIHIIGIPEEEEREKGVEGVLEQIITENLPDLGKEKTYNFANCYHCKFMFSDLN